MNTRALPIFVRYLGGILDNNKKQPKTTTHHLISDPSFSISVHLLHQSEKALSDSKVSNALFMMYC